MDKEKFRILVIRGGLQQLKDVLVRRNDFVNEALDEYGKTALHYAVFYGRISVVNVLIRKGADVNQKDVNNQVPLHMVFPQVDYYYFKMKRDEFCSGMESREFVRNIIALSLLRKGADPNFPDNTGYTPLHYALIQHSFSLMTLLMKSGAKLIAYNVEGLTPLHLTSPEGILDWALICYGDLDAQDSDGQTLLHKIMQPKGFAVYPPEILTKIISLGATVDIKNRFRQTPLQLLCMQSSILRTLNELNEEMFKQSDCYEYHMENEEILLTHLIKLYMAGMPVRDDAYISRRINCEEAQHGDMGLMKKFSIECLEEFTKLKSTPVLDSITLSHVLTCKLSTCKYLADTTIVNELEEILFNSDIETHFPIYATILMHSFTKLKKRFALVAKASRSLLDKNLPQSFQVLSRDQDAVEYLFGYLSNKDLENLIRSV